jgi:hypothetical protein
LDEALMKTSDASETGKMARSVETRRDIVRAEKLLFMGWRRRSTTAGLYRTVVIGIS